MQVFLGLFMGYPDYRVDGYSLAGTTSPPLAASRPFVGIPRLQRQAADLVWPVLHSVLDQPELFHRGHTSVALNGYSDLTVYIPISS